MTDHPQPESWPEAWEDLLAGYVLGDLTPEEAARLRRQLADRPDLKQELAKLQETLALLPYGLPDDVQPSPALRDRLLAAAGAETPAPSAAPKSRRWPRWTPLAAAIAAVAVGTGWAIDGIRLRQQLARVRTDLAGAELALERQATQLARTEDELQRQADLVAIMRQPGNRFMTLEGSETAASAAGTLAIAPEMASAVLVLQNLDMPSEGEVYRLWAIADGEKIGCADFRPDATGRVYLELPADVLARATGVAVTVEPDRDMPAPTGRAIVTSRDLL